MHVLTSYACITHVDAQGVRMYMYYFMQNRKSYVHLTTQPAPAPKRDEHHLFLKFSALALPVNEPCELFFFIYDAKVYKTLR